MSRPCFALSVMLCCMAGPLFVIGKVQAEDGVVSSSHDPGECVVCPLAYGPLDVCGGYSDYDYNDYWYGESPPTTSDAVPATDPELEVAELSTDEPTDEAWESGYEDYYAEYVFGDDLAPEEAEEPAVDEGSSPSEPDAEQSDGVLSGEPLEHDESADLDDEYGWYTDDAGSPEDYFDSFDSYEPIESSESESISSEESTAEVSDLEYEAYEDEWFSYDVETNTDMEVSEPATDIESKQDLETGYDAAYDEAMAERSETTEPTADNPPPANAESDFFDTYESFYDAYDDLYNFEASGLDFPDSASSQPTPQPIVEEDAQPVEAAEPAWLTELVNRMLAPVWAADEAVVLNAPNCEADPVASIYVDECAQEWDCETDYWTHPQPEPPSVVLGAADTLDEMASLLQNAAELLRGLAGDHVAETAQAVSGNTSR